MVVSGTLSKLAHVRLLVQCLSLLIKARRIKYAILITYIFLSLRGEKDLVLIQLERGASIGFIWGNITLNTLK